MVQREEEVGHKGESYALAKVLPGDVGIVRMLNEWSRAAFKGKSQKDTLRCCPVETFHSPALSINMYMPY